MPVSAPRHLVAVSMSVDMDRIRAYAALSDDYNPLHVDPVFAAGTEMGGPIAHGTLSLNLVWQSAQATLGAAALAGARLQARFLRPVRPGDTVTAGGQSPETDPGCYAVWVRDAAGNDLITGTLTLADIVGD